MPDRELAKLRGDDIGIVFQEPRTALNPIRTVGRQIAESIRIHEGLRPSGSQRARNRGSGTRTAPRSRVDRGPVPAPALGRSAPARRDRMGTRLSSAAAHRRRADHRPRRHDPGRDPLPAARARRRRGDVARVHHARPRRARAGRDRGRGARARTRRRGRPRLDAAVDSCLAGHPGPAAGCHRDSLAPETAVPHESDRGTGTPPGLHRPEADRIRAHPHADGAGGDRPRCRRGFIRGDHRRVGIGKVHAGPTGPRSRPPHVRDRVDRRTPRRRTAIREVAALAAAGHRAGLPGSVRVARPADDRRSDRAGAAVGARHRGRPPGAST